jgi:hypothetical protein
MYEKIGLLFMLAFTQQPAPTSRLLFLGPCNFPKLCLLLPLIHPPTAREVLIYL